MQQTATAQTADPYNNPEKEQAPWAYAATQSTSGSNHEKRLIRETVAQDARLKGKMVIEQVNQLATESPKQGRPRPVSAIAQEL